MIPVTLKKKRLFFALLNFLFFNAHLLPFTYLYLFIESFSSFSTLDFFFDS